MKSYFTLCFGALLTLTSFSTVTDSAIEAGKTSDEKSFYKIIKKAGYYYDGVGCWIYGVWVTDTNSGSSVFFPGSAANQALNNVCGWDDVAFEEPPLPPHPGADDDIDIHAEPDLED